MRFVLASHNKKKLSEMSAILEGLGIEVVPLPDDAPEPEEDGKTFEDNARIKALAAHACTGLPAIADDSGLEVDALGGAPGVYSARWSGEGATDEKNNAKLLDELRDVPADERTARFKTVVTCAFPDGKYFQCDGVCEGRVLTSPDGDGGFGYDPLFWSNELGKSFGSATPEEKNRISHRGRAMRSLCLKLPEFLPLLITNS